jgi:hypothetical protein
LPGNVSGDHVLLGDERWASDSLLGTGPLT